MCCPRKETTCPQAHTKKKIIETSPFEWAIRATIFSEATPTLMSDTAMNACFARQTQCRWRFYLTAMMQPHFNFTPQHVHTTICRWHTTNRTSAVEWQFNNKQKSRAPHERRSHSSNTASTHVLGGKVWDRAETCDKGGNVHTIWTNKENRAAAL